MMHEILHVVLQHCFRINDRDKDIFNVACDIVVNSTILESNDNDLNSITLRKYGVSMHLTPDKQEGRLFTAEQVYDLIYANVAKTSWDDHSHWSGGEDEMLRELWVKRLEDACEAISIQDPANKRGLLPALIQRMLEELKNPQIDWRQILTEFVQEEVCDYSFAPPDRRFLEGDFFLPDFNDKEDTVEDILFMIDTSGSMSDAMVAEAYSQIKGAIDQFNGRLRGWLGFFDAKVVEPKPFGDEDEFKAIRPVGGGGTDFKVIFEYVNQYMQDKLPVSIVILTDGYAPFPKEELSMGIPVLWLINNEKITPPWGKIARIKEK